jgi:hypothetical protein
MIIGKGSLFLGRMTNLFDGVSFIMQKNSGKTNEPLTMNKEQSGVRAPKIVLAGSDNEHGTETLAQGAALAAVRGIDVTYAGGSDAHAIMETMLRNGEADAAVTMHYPFPIGVSTVGRVVTPGQGKTIYIATTTGTSSTDRVEGMVRNALYGIITAKACGVKNPTVGILNIDGARQAEMALKDLHKNGYAVTFAESGRSDGGCILRGNDVLAGTCDVLVTDPLTGNILIKMLSSFTTGGSYESLGWGYGPGIGQGYDKLVLIVSRASGVPVIAGAIEFAAELVRGRCKEVATAEFAAASRAGLAAILAGLRAKSAPAPVEESAKEPPKEIVTAEIAGIEITDLDAAVEALWKEGVYAQSGMGCTGPIVLVNEGKKAQAEGILQAKGFVQ